MVNKIKLQYSADVNKPHGRDKFQTPNYAIELLYPYVCDSNMNVTPSAIWECACGSGQISKFFKKKGHEVISTDIDTDYEDGHTFNFLTQFDEYLVGQNIAIVTNPPFSLKQEFYKQCLKYKVPFALLVPADYSLWIIRAIRDDGAQKIIPERRIDYITPNEVENSSSNFHSMWLTKGLNLGTFGTTEIFVPLSNKTKENVR